MCIRDRRNRISAMSISATNSPFPAHSPTPDQEGSLGLTMDSESHINMFQNIIPNPISVSRDLSNGTAVGVNGSTKQPTQYSLVNLNVFQTIPKETTRGVDDLTRMKMALISGIPEELKWALKKYLAYSNKAPYMISLKTLPDLLPLFKRFILDLQPLIENFNSPSINDAESMDKLQCGINSILILRNLAQDTDSIQVLVADQEIQQFLLFVLQKFELIAIGDPDWQVFESNSSSFNELVHYTIDLMEGISSYIAPAKKDDLYFKTLVSILNYTKDRYMVISILRSLSRLLVRSKEDEESAADNLDKRTLTLIVSFLLIENDSELIIASLDFLYQYILPGNQRISGLFNDDERFSLFTAMLPRLLTYNIDLPPYSKLESTELRLATRIRPPAPTVVPEIGEDLFQDLLTLNEPMLSSAWLRCCFEPVDDAEFTQILLWRSYEGKFSQPVRASGRKLLAAVEFIKNVSNAFNEAAAMVITDPSTGNKRFVIKGIQPRVKPVSIEEGELASKTVVPGLKSKFLNDPSNLMPATQCPLPEIEFPTTLSDVSKVTATFLCLVSNLSLIHI